MIIGGHSIIYSTDAEADRAFFRDVLKFPNVDVGHGWLIFGLPPAEVAVHPSEKNDVHEFYLMCDDVEGVRRRDGQASHSLRARAGSGLRPGHAGDPAGRWKARRVSSPARAAARSDRRQLARVRLVERLDFLHQLVEVGSSAPRDPSGDPRRRRSGRVGRPVAGAAHRRRRRCRRLRRAARRG